MKYEDILRIFEDNFLTISFNLKANFIMKFLKLPNY
jgi:hypothetical protein